jgi:hypothetical protein
MAQINSFGSLKAALSGYMFNQRFTPQYDLAVQIFEAVANRRLRTHEMENVAYLTTSSPQADPYFIKGFCDLPADYLAWRAVRWRGRNPSEELDYVHPAYFDFEWRDNPRIFTIEDGTFFAAPEDNSTGIYEFHYYQKIPTILEGENVDNWLINAHPDVYLEGTLTELFALGRNGEAAQLHKARRDEIMVEIVRLSSLTTGASSPTVRGQGAEYF